MILCASSKASWKYWIMNINNNIRNTISYTIALYMETLYTGLKQGSMCANANMNFINNRSIEPIECMYTTDSMYAYAPYNYLYLIYRSINLHAFSCIILQCIDKYIVSITIRNTLSYTTHPYRSLHITPQHTQLYTTPQSISHQPTPQSTTLWSPWSKDLSYHCNWSFTAPDQLLCRNIYADPYPAGSYLIGLATPPQTLTTPTHTAFTVQTDIYSCLHEDVYWYSLTHIYSACMHIADTPDWL